MTVCQIVEAGEIEEEGERPTRSVTVTCLNADYSGLSAYMNLRALNRMIREGPTISGAFLSVDQTKQVELMAELKETPVVAGATIKKLAEESFLETIGENLLMMRMVNMIFSCIIAFGIVYNTSRISLAERSRELATMRITGEDSTQEDWQVNNFSPINGLVLRLIREDAGVVSPSINLMEVGDTSDLETEIDVLSTDAVRIRPGDKILVEHRGKDVPLNAVVRRIEPAAFTKVSALGVEEQRVNVIADLTDLPEKWETLGDAYRVDVRIVTWEQDDLLLVPTSVLFRYGETWSVFCERNQLAELTTVEVGHSDGILTEVISGLEA